MNNIKNKLKSLIRVFISQLNLKKQKSKGFSLIELLVVVGIMGILAAVAIPAYNQYRKNAAEGAFTSTATNIARAFQSCVAVNPFAQCDTLAEINMSCPNCQNTQTKQPLFCVDMEDEIGGEVYKGCVSTNSGTGATTQTMNVNSCYADGGAKTAGWGGVPTNPACTTGQDVAICETITTPLVRCIANQECIDTGSNYCIGGSTGLCDTTNATCG